MILTSVPISGKNGKNTRNKERKRMKEKMKGWKNGRQEKTDGILQ
jgi:hypothetical protein